MVTAPIAVNSYGSGQPARPGRRGLRQSLGIALGTLALAAAAALLVGTLENQVLTSAYNLTGVTKVLPADLFAAPKAPKPYVMTQSRYVVVTLPPKTWVIAQPSYAPMPSASASHSATPRPSYSPRTSSSPSPSSSASPTPTPSWWNN